MVNMRVTTLTADVASAGTTSGVSLVLYGAGGQQWGPVMLGNVPGQMQRGCRDVMHVQVWVLLVGCVGYVCLMLLTGVVYIYIGRACV